MDTNLKLGSLRRGLVRANKIADYYFTGGNERWRVELHLVPNSQKVKCLGIEVTEGYHWYRLLNYFCYTDPALSRNIYDVSNPELLKIF